MKKRCPPAEGWPRAITFFLVFSVCPLSWLAAANAVQVSPVPAQPVPVTIEPAETPVPEAAGSAPPASPTQSRGVESPRERGRVLQKRNPIASEYQVIGTLGQAPGAAADGEGTDFRAFFAAGALPLRADPSVRLDTFAQYQGYRGRFLPGASVQVFTPLPTQRPAGVELLASLTEVERFIEHYESAWANIGSTPEALDSWILERPRFSRDQIRTRVRTLRLRGEYALSPAHTLYAQLITGDYNDLHFRNRLELNFRTAEPSGAAEGVPNRDITYTAAETGSGTARRYFGETTNRRSINRLIAGGQHTAPRWGLAYSGYASRWINRPLVHAWNFADRGLEMSYSVERPAFPAFTLGPVDRISASNESMFSNYRIQATRTTDSDLAGRGDFDLDLNGAGQWRLFTGTLYREKERVNDHDRNVFGPSASTPLALASVSRSRLPEPVVRGQYFLPPWIDSASAISLRNADPSPYVRNNAQSTIESYEQRYTSFESVAGLYALLAYNGQRVDTEIGARGESTRTRTRGTIVVPEAFATSGQESLDEVNINGERRLIQERQARNQYTNLLPSVAVTYRPARDWHLRLAAYDSLLRPQYFDIVEYRRVAIPTRTISEGNPSLAPTTIRTYLASAERRELSIGSVAVELYRIEVSDFFYTAQRFETINEIEFSVSREENGEKGTISGFQVQWFSDLPPLFEDLRATLSTAYTYSDSEASVPTRPGEAFALPERSRHLLRTSLRLRYGRATANIEFSYQSAALDLLGESAGRDIYRDDVLGLNTALSYAFARYTLSGSVQNLLNHPERAYAGEPKRVTRNQYSSHVVRLGVSAQF